MKTGGHCNLVTDGGCSVDAARAAVLSGLDIVSSSKEEQRMALKAFPTSDWLWQGFSLCVKGHPLH